MRLKFTPPQGTITITSNLRKKTHEIKDNEMFAEILSRTLVSAFPGRIEKVFNKYEQTEAGKDAALKGTGLGLAICREIVELHNGEVWVNSELRRVVLLAS